MKNIGRFRHTILFGLLLTSTMYGQSVTGVVKLTNNLGVEVLNYTSTDSLYIQVADADRDINASAADTVSVYVTSQTETTAEKVVLTETGVSTGVFMGKISFDEVGAVAADGKLQVKRGDKLTGTYVDPKDDFGNVKSVSDNAFYGVSLASGILYTNTVWQKSKSPYLVTGDVTVNSGVTLTIEPGVQVRFMPTSDDLRSGEDINRSELRVNGWLNAVGSPTDSIIFTSNSETPTAGDWYGIYVFNSNSRLTMQYARVEYGTMGVRMGYGNNQDTVRIENTLFRQTGTAALSQNTSLNRPLVFNYNTTDGDGINTGGYTLSFVRIVGNTIGKGGIQFYVSNNGPVVEVRDNTIYGITSGMGGNGINITNYGDVTGNITGNKLKRSSISIGGDQSRNINYVISGNTIDSASYAAISVSSLVSVIIQNDTIRNLYSSYSGNTYAGIQISSGNRVIGVKIRGNVIAGNNAWGMRLYNTSGVVDSNQVTNNQQGGIYMSGDFSYPSNDSVKYNTITGNNGDGIQNENYSKPVVQYNNLNSNFGYDYKNNTPISTYAELDAKYNWWGTTTTTEMTTGANPKNIGKIYDKQDNPTLGFVNYGGWLNAQGGTPAAITATGTVRLTNSVGIEVLNYTSTDSMYIQVMDADRDINASAADTVSVYVTSQTETTAEKVVLTETGVSTGVFMGKISFDEVGAVAADGKLQVKRGDKLTGTYVDPKDDFGNVKSVSDNAFYGVSLASGILYTNTVWQKSKSPYLVTGDVTVNSGVTLTIEPGVQVRFMPTSDDLRSGEDINRSELRVNGWLNAVGSPTDSIIFTSNSETPTAGDWYGIYVFNSNSRLTMQYARVEYGTMGVRMGYGNNQDTVRIENTLFRQTGTAALSQNTSLNRPLVFNYNTTDGDGINTGGYTLSFVRIVGNTIGKGGIQFYVSNNGPVVEVRDNTIYGITSGMGGNGINITNYGDVTGNITGNKLKRSSISIGGDQSRNINYVISGNTIDSASYAAISVSSLVSVIIQNDTIRNLYSSYSGNTYAGIQISSGNRVIGVKIRGNVIAGNNAWGMRLYNTSGVVDSNQVTNNQQGGIYMSGDFSYPSNDSVKYNTITGNNGDGIQNENYSKPVVQYNNLNSNFGYDYKNNTPISTYAELDAKYNWWGTTTTTEMTTGANPKNIGKIYDKQDNPTLGFVNYGGWLNAQGGTPAAITATGTVRLTNSVGIEVLNYTSTDSMYIQVMDADRDINASAADTVSVYVTSQTETTAEKVVLTETGVSTGVFMGKISFDEVGAVAADGKLQVKRGDKLTGTYVDPKDDFGNVKSVSDNAFYGVSLASGILYTNTVWQKSKSPYLVTGDVTVNSGVTLTIEPGVQVRFMPTSDDLRSGEDINRSELRVNGWLNAVGSPTDSIIFTSNSETPTAGDWYGIYVFNSNSRLTMQYARVEYGTMGVRMGYGNNQDTVRIENTLFRQTGTAALSQNTSLNRPLVFNYNTTDGDGINTGGYTLSFVRIVGNTIGKGGIQFYVSNNGPVVEVRDNTIYGITSGMGGNGINITNYGDVTGNITGNKLKRSSISIGGDQSRNINYVISGNTIDSASYAAISVSSLVSVIIQNDTIRNLYSSYSGNTYAGIQISSGNRVIGVKIRGNVIAGNNAWGMRLYNTSGVVDSNQVTNNQQGGIYMSGDFSYPSNDSVKYNTITGNNGDGIQNENYSKPVVQYNNLNSNFGYDYKNNTPISTYAELDAKYNWWGTTTTTEMTTGANPKNIGKIYDKQDNPTLGFVNYGQWLTELLIIGVPGPGLVSPADSATGIQVTPMLSWSPSVNATLYRLQVSTNSSFTAIVCDYDNLTSTSKQLSQLATNTRYYWRVRASDGKAVSGWSQARSFFTIVIFPPPSSWTFTANTGGNATIAIPLAINPTIGTQLLRTGDAVGVFFKRNDSLICAGYGLWQEGQNMPVTVWADNAQTAGFKDGFAQGEIMLFKIWDGKLGRDYPASVSYQTGTATFSTNSIYELASLIGVTSITHRIILPQGWNILSSFVQPRDSTVDTVMVGIRSSVRIMKNGSGQVYWPAYNINQIVKWNYRHGYQIYMSKTDTLSLNGTELTPEWTPIQLSKGWNMAAYLRNLPMRTDSALVSIAGSVVIVKNNFGQLYWPQFGINTIGSMMPGRGYQLFVNASGALTYPVNGSPSTGTVLSKRTFVASQPDVPVAKHYRMFLANTGSSAIILVQSSQLANGDEIAVWTSGKMLVGCGVMSDGKCAITAWGDDLSTKDVQEGAIENETLTLTAWSPSDKKEKELKVNSSLDALTSEKLSGSLVFKDNAVIVIQSNESTLIPDEFSLDQNYPNPFNPSTTIRFGLPHDSKVTIELYSILGQRVATLLAGNQMAGYHQTLFTGSGLASGVYFYRLRAEFLLDNKTQQYVQTKKLLLMK